MKKYSISIKCTEDISTFVKIVSQYDCDIDIRKEDIVIDAKSILGVMTICPNNDLELIIYSNDHEEILDSLSDFIVERKTA